MGYLLIAFAYTAGVWGDPAHSSAGPLGDDLHWINFLAWTPHALSHWQNPLFMPLMDFPRGVNLAWNTSAPLAGVLMWPTIATFGPVVAYNAFVLIAITLDGWCTYIWVRRHVRSAVAAFLSSLVVVLGPWIPAHISHLNLLAFWFLPLMFVAVENVVEAKPSRHRWALLLGVFAAAQFYLSEELAALGLIATVTGLAVALVVYRRRVRNRLRHTVSTLAISALAFIVLIAPFLIYQLAGPYPVKGTIQQPNTFVADVENLVIATPATWLWPRGFSSGLSAAWTGPAEATAYIGVPLLVATALGIWRAKGNAKVLVVALATVVMVLLSLGPELHVGGASTGIPLPAMVFSHLPLADNLLPVRFSLFAGFGFAWLVAATLDLTMFAGAWRDRAIALPGITAIMTVVSVVPMSTSPVVVPSYFAASGGVSNLPRGTVALVGPYIGTDVASATPMVWQATSDFRITLIDGMAITADPQGHPTFLLSNPMRRVFQPVQMNGILPPETTSLRTSLLGELHRDHVSVVLLGPMAHRDIAIELVTWLLGTAPQEIQGVDVWNHIPAS